MIRALQGLGFAIWVVSGSNKWSVEPVFERLGIPAHQVIGIEMDDQQGVLTSKEVLPIPIRQDKVAAFQRKNAIPPILVATDSKNDIPLLLLSTDLKVRVNSRGRDTDDFFRTVGTLPDSSWVLVESPTLIDDGAV